ncbi:uncharacterized protein LOC143534058 [Bidens hawaiensis]|uniref:uncharacterized protein LOC143534058 n=1 Tax=Bidens hawaiensis TaxID=980011 RepID=UPI0040496F60
MELFEKSVAVRLKTHLDKYLVADDDRVSVRQSLSAAGTRRARWLIEHVDTNTHVIRLKSCHGNYLTASNTPGSITGKKVVLDNIKAGGGLAIEWQPVRDGFQVKLKTSSGTYLRASGGGMVPWRNCMVTHDSSCSNTDTCILFDVEAVDVPEDQEFSDYLSMVSNFSSVSDEISGLEFGSIQFSPRAPVLSMKKRQQTIAVASVMELFHNAKAVRLKNHHNKYLYADEDQESVSQDRNGASKNNRWTVEFVTQTIIRLKSCYNKYLTASNQPFLLGMTGRKVLQTMPTRLDSSVEWEPVREGSQVKLKTRYGQYLRANGGLPPWRNSVTHDIPHRTATQEWILWDVDVVDIVVHSPAPPLIHHSDSFTSTDDSANWSRQEEESSNSSSPAAAKVEEGRAIYYHVVSDDFGEMDENAQGFCINFKGNDVTELTHKLEEETGLKNITNIKLKCLVSSIDRWTFLCLQSSNSSSPAAAKVEEGRAIYYHVVSDDFGEMDENAQGFCINFKGNDVTELTHKLEEETGLKNITVCTRSPLNGNLYPLRLQLPPNNVTMKVVVVHNSSSQQDE